MAQRPISAALIANLMKQHTDDGLLPLLTVAWNDGVLVGTIRICVNDTNQTSNGNTFTAGDFAFQLPDEDSSDKSMLQLVLQDVDLSIRTQLRQLDSRYPATATLDLVLISNPDSVEHRFTGKLRNVRVGQIALVGSVELYEDKTREPAVQWLMSRAYGFNSMPTRGG